MCKQPTPRSINRLFMGRKRKCSNFLWCLLTLWIGKPLEHGVAVSAFCPSCHALPGPVGTGAIQTSLPRKEPKQLPSYMNSIDIAEAAATTIEEVLPGSGSSFSLVDMVLHEPVVWSTLVMLSIVSLLLAWEEAIKTVRKVLPEALMPVVDSMLAEMGGLGFIGVSTKIILYE